MKEKTQLKERNPFQQEQSIKETNTIGLQFNYLIPSMGKSIIVCVSDCVIQLTDNIDCLSDVQVAEKKLFLVQGRKPQLMNWEQFGLRIGIEEESLFSSKTVEIATAALVGGEFKFPKNTVLVSAVYAVSVSEPLLKPLRLEMQHCVDLRGRPGLSQYLKFAIAPVSTPSLPYQFSLVEGGEFTSNSWYGAINREDFCLVCIVGEAGPPVSSINGDNSGDEEEEQEEQEEGEVMDDVEKEREEEDKEEDDGSSDSSSDSSSKDHDPPEAKSTQGQYLSLHIAKFECVPIVESTSNQQGEAANKVQKQEEGQQREGQDYNERGEVEQNQEQTQLATAPIPCTETSSDHSKYQQIIMIFIIQLN